MDAVNDAVMEALLEEQQAHMVGSWMHMREGVAPPWRGARLFRQNKPVLQRACALLGMPESGPKAALLSRLRTYVFSTEQRAEMREFKASA